MVRLLVIPLFVLSPELAPRDNADRARHVIEVLQVKNGNVVADIGCGSGWLSEAIAKVVGPEGKVYAVEIRKSAVEKLRKRDIPHVIPVLSVADDASLPENSLDVAMLHDVASHVTKKARPKFYASVARALKAEGRLVIFGPHGRARRMLDELRGFGFYPENERELDALDEPKLDAKLRSGIRFRYRVRSF